MFPTLAETIQGLQNYNKGLLNEDIISLTQYECAIDALNNLERQKDAHQRNAHYLISMIDAAAQLHADGVDAAGQDLSNAQMSLAESARRDSAMIRIITIVTLLYLPTTFVATLFGMQFFYLTEDHRLAVAPELWVVFAIAVPLTAISMQFWLKQKFWTKGQNEKSDDIAL